MYYGRCENGEWIIEDLTVNYLLLLSLIYSSIPFWPHKLETLVLFTFSFFLLVYCFAVSVVVVLVVMRHGESISCVNAQFVEQNAVYSTTKVTK